MKTKITFSIFVLLILCLFTYNFFLNSFIKLEEEQNLKNINSLITSMDKELNYIKNTTSDYATWDDTYNFIKTKNREYIDENFAEGSNTLENLQLDFMIFTSLDNKKIYSNFVKNDYKNSENFQKDLLKKFQNIDNVNTIYKDFNNLIEKKSTYFYVTKKSISNTNNTLAPNGFIYTGKIIKNIDLKNTTKLFQDIWISEQNQKNFDLELNSNYLKNIKINIVSNDDNYLQNSIQLFDFNNIYTLTIITKSKRELINKGKKTILTYTIMNFIFLFLIFLLIFKNEQILKNYNEKLKKEVEEKTKEIQDSNKQLKILSEQDYLTKIKNRRYFFEIGDKIVKNSIIKSKKIFVVMIDLDDFKKINDSFGHSAGDSVLLDFTNKVNTILDDKYLFGRLGGEEFSITFDNIDENKMEILIKNIKKRIEDSIISFENEKIKYTVSMGISTNENFNSLDKILKNADKLLYVAKSRGKNCIIRQRDTE